MPENKFEKSKHVPKAVIKRLALYVRALHRMELNGESRVSSKALSDRLGINPAQVRKDLAYFGQFGVPGYGYRTSELREQLRSILGTDREIRVAIVGVGNLGKALLSYVGFRSQGFKFVAAFDADPKKIGRSINDIVIYSAEDIEDTIKKKSIELVILAIPAPVAQEVTNRLVASGIHAILNFVPLRLKAPPNVKVHYVDLAMELESLSFYLR